ncbi:hypothetical protein HDU86_002416 [Geranomyces michiganensis]|nr:hypothetical protein HDU86_002416 [Geranomyces michiganensis]
MLQKRHYKTGVYSPEMILATNGVSGAVSSTLAMIASRPRTNRPPRCALFVPFYTYHQEAIRTMLPTDTEIVYIPSKEDMSLDLEALALEAPRLDFLVFSNPGNPSSHALDEEEVRELERIAAANPDMIVFSDEIYADIMYAGKHHTFGASAPPNVLVARGFSKIISVGSWRLGYLLGQPATLAQVATFHDRLYIGANITQMAVGMYLRDHYDDFCRHVDEFNATLSANADMILDAFKRNLGWTVLPGQGSMYRLVRHTMSSDEAAFDLLVQKCGIAVVPGSLLAPGASAGYLRIHVGFAAEKAKEVCKRLAAASTVEVEPSPAA